MSLLNSVLSSINGGPASAPKPSVASSAPKPVALPRKDNGVLGAARSQASNTKIPIKRKAEDAGNDVKVKAPRVDPAATLSAPVSRSITASPAQRQGPAPPPKLQVPYRGTAGPVKPSPTSTSSKPVPNATSAPTTPSTAPKSGYLATLERAKAAQEAAKQLGQIKHKPAEKLTKKDRLKLQAEAAAARKGKPVVSRGAARTNSRSKSAEPIPSKGTTVKKERKPVEVGYKGTMRPTSVAPAYSGTMRPPGSAVPRTARPGPSKGGDRYRYASYSDEEDEMENDEEEGYESEGSSAMEAGMDEVDFEEEEALRIARREDAEALRQEAELKRAKLEKKRKLEELAAAAKKRGNRY